MRTPTHPTRRPPPWASLAGLARAALVAATLTSCMDGNSIVASGRRPPTTQVSESNGQCLAPNAVCGGTCRDLQSDRSHCGACGNACGSSAVCSRGACVPYNASTGVGCGNGLTACLGTGGRSCYDLQSDPNNCGACGRVCTGTSNVCSRGACTNTTSCGAGLAACGSGACVNLANDPRNCGACGRTCAAGQACTFGACALPTVCSAATASPDQTQLGSAGVIAISLPNGQYSTSLGQSFTVGAPGVLSGVEALLYRGSLSSISFAGYTLTLTVRDATNQTLGSATLDAATIPSITPGSGLSAGVRGVGFFDLSASCIPVVPGQALNFTVALSHPTPPTCTSSLRCSNAPSVVCTQARNCFAAINVGATITDTYPGGQLFANGNPQTSWDLAFKTHVTPYVFNCNGQTNCGGTCRDLANDRNHCGACGNVCAAGQICNGMGACATSCLAGMTTCGAGAIATCVNTQTDNANCGACGAVCPSGRVCSAGACVVTCGPGVATCTPSSGPQYCANTQTDRANCGACGAVCPSGRVCSAGVCTTTCLAGMTTCGAGAAATCVNTATDNANCGACGTACPSGFACSGGACAATCGGLATCGSGATAYCARTATDNTNCGTCGTACGTGTVCSGGACVAACGTGSTLCGSGPSAYCAVLATDSANCGACGTACNPGQVCSAGACVADCGGASSLCGSGMLGYCAATATDGANCGACGVTCATGSTCSAGACSVICRAGQTVCGNGPAARCTNLDADNNNCGACGVACGAGRSCQAGACAITCGAGQTICSGACRDLQADNANCGACGTACPSGRVCSAGACVTSCGAGLSVCGAGAAARCVDFQSDNENCGDCDLHCGPGSSCQAAVCVVTCGTGQTNCSGTCRDLAHDRANCGACGVACPSGRVCSAGVCAATCGAPEVLCGGACANPTNDPANCGACGTACPGGGAHSAAVCSDAVCALACNPGWGTCDGVDANGCETDLTTSASHCGVCGNVCDAGSACVAGACAPLPAPRQLGPLSTSSVTTQSPTLRWTAATAPATGAHVQLCADPLCNTVVEQADVAGTTWTPAFPLGPGVYFWRVSGAAGGASGAEHSPVWEFFVPFRDSTVNTSHGSTLDLNGDGLADVAVGAATRNLDGPGEVRISYGAAGGVSAMPNVTLTPPAGVIGFGKTVTSAGDVNGDGYADLVVGYVRNGPAATEHFEGGAYIYLGGSAGVESTPATHLPTILGRESAFGVNHSNTIATAGDVNRDGYSDLAIGSPGPNGTVGHAYVFLGSATGIATGAAPAYDLSQGLTNRQFGTALVSGDFNGDDRVDLAVAAGSINGTAGAGDQGRVYLFLGTATGLPATASVVIAGSTAFAGGERFGWSIAQGDVNGDGYADLAVASPYTNATSTSVPAGRVNVYLGGATGTGIFTGVADASMANPGAHSRFGLMVAARDIDSDGYGDLVVGTADLQQNLRVYLGGATGVSTTAAATIASPVSDIFFGGAFRVTGDTDGDGAPEIVAGAFGAGRAYVYNGWFGAVPASFAPAVTFTGTSTSGLGSDCD